MVIAQDDVKIIHHLMEKLDSVLRTKDFSDKHGLLSLTKDDFDNAKEKTITHHYAFLTKLKIQQTSIDPYKIMSWYGFYLSEVAQDDKKIAVLCAIQIMNNMLKYDSFGKPIVTDLVCHLWFLARNDKVNDDFGVGKNGIYSVFTAASMTNIPRDGKGWAK
jgi:hypothetical protein